MRYDSHVRARGDWLRQAAAQGDPEALATLKRESPHDWLVSRAVRWLRGSRKCGVVLAEVIGAGFEQPDAIGWKSAGLHSVLVECKVSRADFRADLKKPHRVNPGMGMGQERYYLTPRGLLDPGEIPEGWGLLEVRGQRIKTVVKLPKLVRYDLGAMRRETSLLFAAARKAELGLPLDRWHA